MDFQGTAAYDAFSSALSKSASTGREVVGDGFDGRAKARGRAKLSMPAELYPCFASLFQGDHLGVEFALRSHSLLLENHGLLTPDSRILEGSPVPVGGVWDALVIDDYLCLSAEKISTPVEKAVAHDALGTARRAYAVERLLGSTEKDVASTSLKAAGAEIRSGEKKSSRLVPLLEKELPLRLCPCVQPPCLESPLH
jgi:hypothetical protein